MKRVKGEIDKTFTKWKFKLKRKKNERNNFDTLNRDILPKDRYPYRYKMAIWLQCHVDVATVYL